jgi:hypothetical protein
MHGIVMPIVIMMLNFSMLSVIMHSIIMLGLITLNFGMLGVIILIAIMLSVIMSSLTSQKCRHAKCRYAQCRGAVFPVPTLSKMNFFLFLKMEILIWPRKGRKKLKFWCQQQKKFLSTINYDATVVSFSRKISNCLDFGGRMVNREEGHRILFLAMSS